MIPAHAPRIDNFLLSRHHRLHRMTFGSWQVFLESPELCTMVLTVL